MTGIRIEVLDDGYLVEDTRGPRTWRGAAVTMADAQALADHRVNPRGPSAPPRQASSMENSGYAEPHPLAALQFAQATDGAECVGGVCSAD